MASRMANLVCFYEVFGVYAVMCNMISVMNGISTSALVLPRLLGLGEIGSALEILLAPYAGGNNDFDGKYYGNMFCSGSLCGGTGYPRTPTSPCAFDRPLKEQ
jgi:hypothetical protein